MNPKFRLSLSADVLRALHALHGALRLVTLDDLCTALDVGEIPAREGVRARTVRREDVRAVVCALDEEGFVDAARMRLTMQGFALASSLTTRRLVPLHLVA